ncbi:MAG: RHS repeat-associated core domain-containing protein [Luteolibacter sp.]
MNQFCKTALAGFLNFAFFTNQILADLPPITFDSAEWVPYQQVEGASTPGWQLLSGAAVVSPVGEGFGGGKALKLPVDIQQETKISRSVAWDPAQTVAFIDFRLKPAADPTGSPSSFSVNGTQLAFQVPEGSSKGEIWVYNGDDHTGNPNTRPEQWIKSAGMFDVSGTAASDYLHITLRHDYQRNVWDLSVDGKMVAANLAFENRGDNLQVLDFYGSKTGDTLIDEISVSTVNPLFTDLDQDGLEDQWERDNHGNPGAYDRDQINPFTGRSFLDGYLDHLWPQGNAVNATPIVAPPVTIPALALGTHKPVGALKGSLSVGSDGTAAYAVPIDLPKGAAGMEPKISLNYSSGGGNGIMGVGWNLTGLQRITRGPSSAAKDGSYDPMDFDIAADGSTTDRFFLDGERLVCVSGAYGAAGSEYRTEMDSFARITAIGAGPASWKVETKAGLTVTLGGTADSKTSVIQRTLSWGVNRVQDTLGNYYSVEYQRDAASPNYDFVNQQVSRISYTGQVDAHGTVIKSPGCSVDFTYETRPDISRSYSTYAGCRTSERLSKIRVLTGSYVNHSYRLAYDNSYQTGRSLLKSVAKFMRDDDGLGVPATEFNYGGITSGPLWKDPGPTPLPVYGSGLDATSEVNSMVTVEGDDNTVLRLTGDVARAHKLDAPETIHGDTVLQFDFKSAKQVAGAMIGLDDDKANQGTTTSPFFRIGGTGTIALSGQSNFTGPTQPYTTADGWKTFTLPVAALGGADKNYLVFMCVDNDSSDGEDNAMFRNVCIYRTGHRVAHDTDPIVFYHDTELLRYSDSNGKDLGVVAADLDSDGLVDLADWRAVAYNVTGPTSSSVFTDLTVHTIGQTYQNAKGDFVMSSSLHPPSYLPLGCRSSDTDAYPYVKKHHLLAQPMDIDGDGNTDLMGSINVKRCSGRIRNEYGFYTRKKTENGWEWVEKTAWHLPFYLENTASSAETGGNPRTEHFQWADLNSDGYLDLTIHTTDYGRLCNLSTGAAIIGANEDAVFINNGKNGGWTRRANRALPEPLMIDQQDVGRRLVDLDGDGIAEIADSSIYAGALRSKVYRMNRTTGYLWNSTPGMENPPGDPYQLPVALVKHDSGVDQGVLMMDLNGDGMVDLLQSQRVNNADVRKIWLNQGSRLSTPWRLMEPPSSTTVSETNTYRLTHPLHYESGDSRIPYGFEVADLNGDGLVDILYSDQENALTPGADNLAFLNTGNGWERREEWGLPGANRIYMTDGQRTDGKRNARLQDLNGDGFPDLVTGLLGGTPKVWYNNCSPEVLTKVTDGFDTELVVSYKRLNDPDPTTSGFFSRVYEKSTGDLPVGQASIIDSRLVVSRYTEPNGYGGTNYRCQRYGDLRYDRANESSLGFGWIEAMDEVTGQISHTDTMRVFPFGGSPVRTTTSVNVDDNDLASRLPGVTAGMKCLTTETATYAELAPTVGVGGTIHRPVQTSSTKETRDLDGALKSRIQTFQNVGDFDSYGFVHKSSVYALDGSLVVTQSDFNHIVNPSHWLLGRMSGSTVTKSGAGKASLVKKASFVYDTNTGLLTSETIEPGDPTFGCTKTYSHDTRGNITATSVTASGETRTAGSTYSASGRFVTSEANALGQSVSYLYDETRALLQSTTAAGLTTSFGYDAFGTLIHTSHPDGTETGEITGPASNASVPASVTTYLNHDRNGNINRNITYFRAKQRSGTPVVKVYLDSMGRELVTETLALRDAATSTFVPVYTVTRYDGRNRKCATCAPFAAGETALFTTVSYDLLNRVVETVHPDGSRDTALAFDTRTLALTPTKPAGNDYKPMTYSKVKNRDGKILERWEDQHGRLVQSTDPSRQVTSFNYDPEGHLLTVAIDSKTLLTNQYDKVGNKWSVNERNSGTSTSVFNGFGEVVSSTNANGRTTTFQYDVLGRPATVAKPEGTYTTFYDGAAGNGLGKPWKTYGPDGYSETVSYDSYGRATSTRKTQFGETTNTAISYDKLGRVYSETDAGGLTVIHEYTTGYSMPKALRIGPDVSGANILGAGTLLWQAGTFDSQGHALTQTLAQGVSTRASYLPTTGHLASLDAGRSTGSLQSKTYTWDTLGNLTTRSDAKTAKKEFFRYDENNRVINAHVDAASLASYSFPAARDFNYDPNGNLRSKPGASLSYNDATRIHAVTDATIKGASRSYSYDDAGYVISDSKRNYTWTSFGQLQSLDYAAAPALQDLAGTQIYAAARVQTDFSFDAGGNRAKQLKKRIAADSSRKLEETLYFGSYERETHMTQANGSATPKVTKVIHRHTLGGLGVYTRTDDAVTGSVTKLTTILKDHLGSTDVLYTGTWNATSNAFVTPVTEYQSFDPWGERRDPDTLVAYRTTDSDAFRTSAQDYDRGYTGHEQLDDSGLIHMNGRIYDPELGRMLSPDPVVQVPEYSQNFNRYSYVMNNPLNLTDPTGFSWVGNAFHKMGSWLKDNWVTVVVIIVAVVLYCTGIGAGIATALLGNTLAGATAFTIAGTAVTYGTIGTGAVIGAIAGGLGPALSGGSAGDILRGAVVGGIQGGITAGALHAMGIAAENAGTFSLETAEHMAGHGILGGAANVAMGGKFGDGFISAAAAAGASDAGLLGDPNATGPAAVASRTIRAGIIGGTASALGGGKFANGAYTAAFQHLLNAESEQIKKAIMPKETGDDVIATSSVAIDHDGSPTAYAPPHSGLRGDDLLENAGGYPPSRNVVAYGKNGKPLLNDGGYYVCKTSLRTGPSNLQSSYVDASDVPYIALGNNNRLGLSQLGGTNGNLGKYVIIENVTNGTSVRAIVADSRGGNIKGIEISAAAARNLNIGYNRSGVTTRQYIQAYYE